MGLVLAACFAYSLRAVALDFERFRTEHAAASLKELHEGGSRCVKALDADSAIAYYSTSASRYRPGLTSDDARDCVIATLNTGYVWLFMHNNAEQAYPWIIRGIEQCKAEGLEQLLGAATNYLAYVYSTYGDNARAMALYREAVDRSLDTDLQWSWIMTYTELLSFAWSIDSLSAILPEMQRFDAVELQPGTLSAYARWLHEGMKALREGDYAYARDCFIKATEENDAESGREHGDVQNAMFLADALWRGGQRREAVTRLRDAARKMEDFRFLDLSKDLNSRLHDYYQAMGQRDSAEFFRVRYLEIRDSVFNAGRYGKIRDIETSSIVTRLDADLQAMATERDRERQRSWFFAILGAVAVGATLIIIHKNRRLNAVNRQLYLRNVEIMQAAPEVSAAVTTPPEVPDRDDEAHRQLEDLMQRITSVVDTSTEVFDPDFSIDRLAELTDSLPRYVSQAVNEIGGRDFRALIAERRVREACRRLTAEAAEGRVTVAAISQDVGYRSRTHFSKVFKEITGLTPTEYLRQAKNN